MNCARRRFVFVRRSPPTSHQTLSATTCLNSTATACATSSTTPKVLFILLPLLPSNNIFRNTWISHFDHSPFPLTCVTATTRILCAHRWRIRRVVHALPQRPRPGDSQHPCGNLRWCATGGSDDQRYWRACRQYQSRRGGVEARHFEFQNEPWRCPSTPVPRCSPLCVHVGCHGHLRPPK